MAVSSKKAAKKGVKTKPTGAIRAAAAAKAEPKPRRRKLERYTSFRLHHRIRSHAPPISGPITFSKAALKLLWTHRRMFVVLVLVYLVASLVLVRGFSASFDVPEIKKTLGSLVGGKLASITVTASVYGVILGTIGTVGTASGSTYQSLILIVITLATIWCVRTVSGGKRAPVREAFYRGMYPLMVFMVVLSVIGLQLLPVIVGAWLYNVLIGGGILITGLEKFIGLSVFLLLATLSLYMITSSIFGLFISTIPNMTPTVALKSARQLVAHRRLTVLSRVIALIFILPILAGVVMVPFIIFVPSIAEWVFFVLSHFGLVFIVTYLYMVYKELLNE